MVKSRIALASMIFSSILLSGCGAGGSEKDRSLARCERTFARMAPDPSAGAALCSCIINKLEAEGMTIMDTMGNDRGKEITRQCASDNGVSLPSPS